MDCPPSQEKGDRCGEVEVRSTVVLGALPLSCGRQVELTPLRLENVGLGDGLDSYGRLKTD